MHAKNLLADIGKTDSVIRLLHYTTILQKQIHFQLPPSLKTDAGGYRHSWSSPSCGAWPWMDVVMQRRPRSENDRKKKGKDEEILDTLCAGDIIMGSVVFFN
ncbi:hypothetical protein QE152_g31173 [Popillia japonica]|uniref:Uncharacterized protein n=1 Tax=Popillia japonica TaxID=7064 RepID=A0AAW1JCA6_POPJA